MDDRLLIEQHGPFRWLTFNRPDKANALTVDMLERTAAALSAAADDPTVQAVLLRGTGARFFSAGVDVREQPPEGGNAAVHRERRSTAHAALQDAVIDMPKPVVAVLNGLAIGGGAMWALLADACVAGEGAQLSLPEIDLGIATFSGANILEAIGGRALALDLIQSGRRMSALEAQGRGLVRQVVTGTGTELESAAQALAKSLGDKDARAFADNKRWINRSLKAALAEAREQHARHRAIEGREGVHQQEKQRG